MPLFEFKGPEAPLGSWVCVATRMTIETITDVEGGKKQAHGTISGKDYGERGIEFTDPWEAVGVQVRDAWFWVVKRKDDTTAFWRHKITGEVFFTVNRAINEAIQRFVREKLNHFLLTGEAVQEPRRFTGKMVPYRGLCVCTPSLQVHQNSIPMEGPQRRFRKAPSAAAANSGGVVQ